MGRTDPDASLANDADHSRRTLPWEPFQRFLQLQGWTIDSFGMNLSTALTRAKRWGFTIASADEAAIAMGIHPWFIWGDEFYRFGQRGRILPQPIPRQVVLYDC